ncbi:DUF6984 family protein [Pelagibacterium halotolerans]|uniref:DUF6984 family protein n=1 Tax=Pelagibacterium halotolerans TaxID=531813 RepID=UPI00384EF715
MRYDEIRRLNETEIMILSSFNKVPMCNFSYDTDQLISLINSDMGSIRSLHLRDDDLVYAFAQCQFHDEDRMAVVVTLLLDKNGRFGELDFWRVDDNPVRKFPSSPTDLADFKLISNNQ